MGDAATKADLDHLVSRVREIARGHEKIDVAQLQFVRLAEIQQAYGDRWSYQRTRIQDAAEAFLQHRLGSSDLLVRSDTGFLIILSDTAGPEAHAVVAQLTHGLNAFFLGGDAHSPTPRFVGTAQAIAACDIEQSFGNLIVTPPSANAEVFDLPELEWRFEPVWDVKHEVLSSWYVTPFLRAGSVRLAGYQFEPAPTAPNRLLKVDEASLWIAEQTLKDLVAAQKPTLVGARLHAATLTNLSSRARIPATIDRLDPALHRYRLVTLAGVGPGFPQMYLNEIVGMLKSKLPHIVIGASWDEPDVAGLLRSSPNGIGFSVPPSSLAPGSVIPLPALMVKVTAAIKTAHANRARVLVEGAVTKLLALRLTATGADNIASHSIWPLQFTPNGMLKWPANRLAAA